MPPAKVKTVPLPPPDPKRLLLWYDRQRRVLPWRALPGEVADPYSVWLSEIMLQQTTVVVVRRYYTKFLRLWPNLTALAAAEVEQVFTAWAGLGYYRRARLLHNCAVQVVTQHGGRFPADEAALKQLPGIGDYTAAAIAAIAFGQSANVVDGNVERIMARLYVLAQPLPQSKQQVRALAAALVPMRRGGDYAQALMDLGATVCTPRQPRCPECPWRQSCQAFAQGATAHYPVKTKKITKPVRHATVFWLTNAKGQVWVRRRPEAGLLPGMTEFPSTPWGEEEVNVAATKFNGLKKQPQWRLLPGEIRHNFTHFTLYVKIVTAQVGKISDSGAWTDKDQLPGLALPSIMRKIAAYMHERGER
jgi:A/G-specific adenine glycosylase